ncbi:hypothetical protein LX36DRAFT_572008 [Colletotrichum falcatum]|nr:hypothetical protein LX36DRAFT_572008 [Colletotrichum falcatum]
MASENGNAYAFDHASVHPAFGSPDAQPYAFQPQAFAAELEVDPCNKEVIWEGAGSNGAIQTLTSQQLVTLPSSSTGSAQQPPHNSLPPSMLQDESRVRNRFRNIATSSVFSNKEPAQPAPLRSEVPAWCGNAAAPSSFYTDAGPARPHPPRTEASLAAAGPSPAPSSSDPARRDHSHRSRPDAAVSNPYPRHQDNRPVIQDQPSAGVPCGSRPVPSGRPHRPAAHKEAMSWEDESDIVERPTFTEYYENKRKPKPLPPSGRRQFYGRRPSHTPPSPSPTSFPQLGPPDTVPEAAHALTLEEVRRWSQARGLVAPSDVSTVWPQDSISCVGSRR